MTFYDEWLAYGEEIALQFDRSPGVSHDADIPWVTTRQDARVKLMLSLEQGFPTMGIVILKAEIPAGEHTGRHSHGEEGIHILSGEGLVVVSGQTFTFHGGSTIQIPYRAEHQLFNTGPTAVRYASGLVTPLERFVHLAAVVQHEDRGVNDPAAIAALPPETSQYLPDGRRVVIHLEQAPDEDPRTDGESRLEANRNQHYATKYLALPGNGFRPASVAVTHIFEEPSGYHGGRHAHLEATLLVLEGNGYSEINGEEYRWEVGDVLHVPPAMYEHQHSNDTDHTIRYLRFQSGIRYWFTDIWPEGYTSRRIYYEDGNPIIAGWIDRLRER
jgi:quercetin dioxygenase-like cupin family protein